MSCETHKVTFSTATFNSITVYQANAKVIFFFPEDFNHTKTCFDQTQKPSAEESHFIFFVFVGHCLDEDVARAHRRKITKPILNVK